MDKRDSFSRSIYSMLFNWLIEKINSTIAPKDLTSWGK
jgi:myosin heavy subunit